MWFSVGFNADVRKSILSLQDPTGRDIIFYLPIFFKICLSFYECIPLRVLGRVDRLLRHCVSGLHPS